MDEDTDRHAFVERFGALLEEAGTPRMAARVLAALLVTDDGALTSAELARDLHVSPAAISGAVRYLTQVSLLVRERERGSRRDRYVLHGTGLWYEALVRRYEILDRWRAQVNDGIAVVGADTPAGARLVETAVFFDFLLETMPHILDRWGEQKTDRVAGWYEAHPDR